jgi:hypothetical protein
VKHVRLYYFVAAQHAVDDIANRRLKVSRFFELNDPFELIGGEQSDKAFRKKMRGWAETINKQEGLLCFTKSWTNPLMWSHYGDRHRGMCLGFDVYDTIVKPVDYRPGRLPVNKWKDLNVTNPPREVVQRLLTTKFAGWKYENERRVIVPLAGLKPEKKEGRELFFRRFDNDLKLVEVFAGARCCVKWRSHIQSAVEELPLPLKPELIKARLGFKRFRVERQNLGFEAHTWQECSCSKPELHDRLDCAI